MHGFVLGDTYVSWQDTSCLKKNPDGISYLDELKEKISREDMRRTGVYLKPSLGLCNLYAILGEGNQGREEEIFTLGSYLIHRLTGRNCCHITNAAPWGLVDLETKDWDPELLRKLSFDRMRFPEIAREDTQVCGSLSGGGDQGLSRLWGPAGQRPGMRRGLRRCHYKRGDSCTDYLYGGYGGQEMGAGGRDTALF